MRNPHFLYIKTVHKLLCNRNIFPLSGAKIKKKIPLCKKVVQIWTEPRGLEKFSTK